MKFNPFAGISTDDIAGQYAALRSVITDLHGLEVAPAPAARAAAHAQLAALGAPVGADLAGAADLLADLTASGAFDTLLKNTGVLREGEPHPYRFGIQDISAIDPTAQAISLIHTDALDSYFCVDKQAASEQTAPMTVYERETAQDARLTPSSFSNLPSLRFWLFKFLVETNLGKSLIFSNYLEGPDVAAFHEGAARLYGAPAALGPDTALYWTPELVLHVHGQSEPWVTLWVFDQTQPWARDDTLLSMIELKNTALERWAAEAAAKG